MLYILQCGLVDYHSHYYRETTAQIAVCWEACTRQAAWHAEENGAEAIRTIMRAAANAAD